MRHKHQVTNYGRPLAAKPQPPKTPRAEQLIARSKGERTQSAPARDWRLTTCMRAENCNECGRVIEPSAQRYFDAISGHLVRHVACHERAELKPPGRRT